MENMKDLLLSKLPEFTEEERERMNREVAEWEQEQERKRIAKRIHAADIPMLFSHAQINDSVVESWVNLPTCGLLLQGLTGRGKTYLACAALIALAERMTVKFTNFKRIMDECKATFESTESELDTLSRFKNCGCLVIDDFGTGQVTEYTLPIIFEIIDYRSAERKPTIITTNCTGIELMKWLTLDGDTSRAKAIISRLTEYTQHTVEGEDRRRHV